MLHSLLILSRINHRKLCMNCVSLFRSSLRLLRFYTSSATFHLSLPSHSIALTVEFPFFFSSDWFLHSTSSLCNLIISSMYCEFNRASVLPPPKKPTSTSQFHSFKDMSMIRPTAERKHHSILSLMIIV